MPTEWMQPATGKSATCLDADQNQPLHTYFSGLLVVPTPLGPSPWRRHRGPPSIDLSTLRGAYAMAGGFRRLTNYDRRDRHQHKARQKKVACNSVERRQ